MMLRNLCFVLAFLFPCPSFSQEKHALLVARGAEPGWYAEFHKDHLLLITDYGKDTLIVTHDFSSISKKKNFSASIPYSNSQSANRSHFPITISVKNKACSEAGSGEKRERSISIKLDKKILTGCATTK
jgi:uncharacterized membrane protein